MVVYTGQIWLIDCLNRGFFCHAAHIQTLNMTLKIHTSVQRIAVELTPKMSNVSNKQFGINEEESEVSKYVKNKGWDIMQQFTL